VAASHYRFICISVKQIVEKITIFQTGSIPGIKLVSGFFFYLTDKALIILRRRQGVD
jgi:hypothetical protein